MPMTTSILSYSGNKLVPLYPGGRMIPVNLPPGVTYRAGTVLGQVAAGANDVQTVTISGSPTGGTFTLTASGLYGSGAYTAPYNATTAAVQAGLQAIYGPGSVTVTGTAGASYVVTAAGPLAGRPIAPLAATSALTGGTSPAVAVAHTTVGGTAGTWAAYASGNSDGTQVPQLLLEYDCAVDGSGGITLGTVAGGGQFGEQHPTAPAYYSGTFRTEDLVGLDANALGKIGRLVSGTVAKGALKLF